MVTNDDDVGRSDVEAWGGWWVLEREKHRRTSLISHFIKPSDRCLRGGTPTDYESTHADATTAVTSANRSYPPSLVDHNKSVGPCNCVLHLARRRRQIPICREAERLIRDKSDGLASSAHQTPPPTTTTMQSVY